MQLHRLVPAVTAAALMAWSTSTLAQADGTTNIQNMMADDQMTPDRIRDAIEDELFLDPAVPSTRVSVTVTDGIATLTGTVNNLRARERAALLAETVKGVESVVNTITVTPQTARTGSELRSAVVDALLTDPATDSYEVSVSADDQGKVTLSGSVDSWAERRLSETVASGVAGVTAIENTIIVHTPMTRPDTEIAHDIEQTLRWSALVDHALINVSVDDGKVRLTGTVGSAAEKRQAEAKAWTSGVTSVDASGLAVARWARDEDLRETKYVVKPDGDIRDAVERAMLYDPRVNSLNVDTSVQAGYVTLRGTVDSVSASRAAVADARHTVGVTGVRNRLQIRPTEPRTDVAMAKALRQALDRDATVERHDVTVSVIDGTAYLYGTVDNYFEKARADDIAARVSGVTDVDNNLTVRSDRWIGYDPYLGDPYLYGFRWYDYVPGHSWLRDDQIERDIENELWWSPFVDADEVTVEVDDGVATLTGTVDSWSEYRAAAENAYEGGAVWVDNDLIVKRR